MINNTINNNTLRLTSIYDTTGEKGTITYKVYAPYTDNYTITITPNFNLEIYDNSLNLLNKDTLVLNKNDIIYLNISGPINTFFNLTVELKNNYIELPYEINSNINIANLSTYSSNDLNPLKPSPVSYIKRQDENNRGLYVNCNNPEKLSKNEINTSLIKQDVTNKDVFFTFEHNNHNEDFYYGYRVTNTGDEDVFITVKNLGYHFAGAGSWLGEDEWIKFYNIDFESSTEGWSQSQIENYIAYVGFCNTYKSENRKPITYRIPKGKYIYVIGGTTKDSYQNINVFDSANHKINTGCSNGAVLFSVNGGTAEGSFLVYTDDDAKTVNNSKYVTTKEQIGYIVINQNSDDVGSQYAGYDNCHGVVDADLYWIFNDNTPSGSLPVTYSNPYFTESKKGTPYSKIDNFTTKAFDSADYWMTHINPNGNIETVGTDMTNYITTDNNSQKDIILGFEYFDGKGDTANIGNWMVDYIDNFTLVNQGDKERIFTYRLEHTGVILAFIRNEKGEIDKSYKPKYCTRIKSSTYGDEINDDFIYSIKVPAHSIIRFSVNYNLLANSYGCIKHYAKLK